MADWQKHLAKLASKVETKIDQQRERLGMTGGRGKAARIEAYRGYGCADRAYVKGRVLRGNPVPAARAEDSLLLNLAGMIQRFESDEVPGARVRVRFPGGEQTVTADEEGYFECWMHPLPPFPPGREWHWVDLELVEPREGDVPHTARARVMVPPPGARFGVISDLDDTVVRTDVTSTLRMMRTVFLGNARTRMPFPGVAAFYRALERGTGGAPMNPVFYVSSSPWNLHDLLMEFLEIQGIPAGPLMLRDWGISETEVLPTSNAAHKRASLERILGLFPALPFILIGDSGQEDPEIYSRVVHDYPDRILAVYIRNVTPRPERLQSIHRLALEVEKAGSALILADDTVSAAKHAAEKGWIDPAALAEIGAVAADEEKETPAGTERRNEQLSTDAT